MDDNFYSGLLRMANEIGDPSMYQAMDRVFAMTKKSHDMNHGVETRAKEHLLEWYTKRTAAKILHYYWMDYMFLGLSVPTWVTNITH